MIPILDEIYPDFIGTANGKTITLDTYRRSVKIILGSEVFTPEEIKYLSDTLEYNDLVKIIIFNYHWCDKNYYRKAGQSM